RALSPAAVTVKPRSQDAGTPQNVYVFAVAPGTIVTGAVGTQCVIAQADTTGQLTAASTSNLRADFTGIMSPDGTAISILQNVPTVRVAGATFYAGYGTSSTQMLASAVNQRAFSVAVVGSPQCVPQPPATGWWWNPAEGGRGYSIEARGANLFFTSFLY